ncbi:MAG: pantoate--beta-alanine ligase [Firmicutes bacterium]|nr:pantoate--beta-alanine ligase [Bacillota bacterium]
MLVIEKIQELRKTLTGLANRDMKVGLVPTMGYLHEGHLSLIRRAKAENDLVVVSIFVNPAQFGPNEDFQRYPRDLERDQELAEAAGTDILFAPEVGEMYPEGYQTYVEVTGGVARRMCGASRPGHFRGVATVVLKLFNIVEPDRAYFGEKDAQQLRVIRRMARDLNLKVEIIGCPIVREADGLALSSRNVYLNQAERKAALILYRTLSRAKELIEIGERDAAVLREQLIKTIAAEPSASLDYLEIADSESLEPVAKLTGEIIIALAVRIGTTRLIDNMVFRL